MKHLLILTFILVSAMTNAQSGEKNFIDQNYIEVTGTAEVNIVPNEIQITISVSEKDFKMKQSLAEYEKDIISRLKEIGIPVEKEFSVMDINSRLKSSLFKRTEVYSAKQYVLIVHNAETANKVFEVLDKIGIANMVITKFDHSEIEKYRHEIKIKAIKAAKAKASELAEAINQSIGRALYIVELNNSPWQPNPNSNTFMKEGSSDDNSGIDFQKIKLKSSYTVRFELK